MRELIASAKANNKRLRAYNARVAKRIREIKSAKSTDRARLAAAEYRAVSKAISQTDSLLKERNAALASLAGSQRSQLATEIRIAKSQRSRLASQRNTLATLSKVASR